MMKQLDWNQYLSIQNPWTERLLGLVPFVKDRDLTPMDQKDNQDAYAELASFQFPDIDDYVRKQYKRVGLAFEQRTVIAIGEELFESQVNLARTLFSSLVTEIVGQYKPERICELGCGYGINFPCLKAIAPEVYGGDFSQNAVTIAQGLGLDIQSFDFYHSQDYGLIRDRSLIFTSHSIEQLPSAADVLENLKRHRDQIQVVVHFESSFLPERTTLIGALRNRYVELNDYNRDLITLLQQDTDIEILKFYPDYFGINPLNPSCIIAWKFH